MTTIQQAWDVGSGCDHCSGYYIHFERCPMVEKEKLIRDRATELIENGEEHLTAYQLAIVEERTARDDLGLPDVQD